MEADDQGPCGASIDPRPRLCHLVAGSTTPALIRTLSARAAEVQTNQRLPLGATVALVHPTGGRVAGSVAGLVPQGIVVAFKYEARTVAFAMAVLAEPPARQEVRRALSS